MHHLFTSLETRIQLWLHIQGPSNSNNLCFNPFYQFTINKYQEVTHSYLQTRKNLILLTCIALMQYQQALWDNLISTLHDTTAYWKSQTGSAAERYTIQDGEFFFFFSITPVFSSYPDSWPIARRQATLYI